MALDGVVDLSGQVSLNLDKTDQQVHTGNYSDVYKGLCQGQEVAVKVIRFIKGAPNMNRKIIRETIALCSFDHPNILPCLGFAKDIGNFGAIISPWCKYGDACQYLNTQPSLHQRVKLLLDVANGLSCLHQANPLIVHGDLKPANILINDQHRALIGDFGLVRLIRQDGMQTGLTTTSEYTGTVRYLAYELVKDHAVPTTASDIYALACIALMFVCSQEPYDQITRAFKVYGAIGEGIPPATRPSDLNDVMSKFWDFLERCWSQKAEERPSIQDFVTFLETWGSQIADD